MAELTKEVIERVAAELQSRCHFKEIETSFRVAEAIIPLAQLPWDEPTAAELQNISYERGKPTIGIITFVRLRNAALQSKPVDPRIAVILGILDSSASTSDVKAKEITAAIDALDGAK